MDAIAVVTTLVGVTRYLIEVVDKVQQNREECKRLAEHADEVVQFIHKNYKAGLPKDLELRLVNLSE